MYLPPIAPNDLRTDRPDLYGRRPAARVPDMRHWTRGQPSVLRGPKRGHEWPANHVGCIGCRAIWSRRPAQATSLSGQVTDPGVECCPCRAPSTTMSRRPYPACAAMRNPWPPSRPRLTGSRRCPRRSPRDEARILFRARLRRPAAARHDCDGRFGADAMFTEAVESLHSGK
jgi:hypothetical protein